jgi:NitT/TauT family transport system permease protein
MCAAYILSLLFTLVYGYVAAHHRTAEKILMPLLDVLQSVPILSFLPVVLSSFSVILPEGIAAEMAAVVLIFNSQVWNMTYSLFQSMRTVPRELQEASAIFRLNPRLRFRKVELPFAAVGLIWNSIMSWAGGLMASEIFTVGARDFRLAGEFSMELDDLLPVIGAGELLGFVKVLEGDLLLTEPVRAYAEAGVLGRKEMLASRILRLPVIGWIYETLQRDDDQRVAKDYFLDRLRPEFHDRREKQLDRAIQWGRFAELFAYDDDTDELYLE